MTTEAFNIGVHSKRNFLNTTAGMHGRYNGKNDILFDGMMRIYNGKLFQNESFQLAD